ncbi:hypothetical protein DV532_25575 (plasmid) [Pseudomonas sp. Leaf58]|uniref:hypothetical protein n=1 Tax=Pseudomonas sp. Leaf58 TaxID=1736226 RepID=UPI0006F758B2|nr:hypothetical protein [Pseudomonas sp. Leaf58]AYG47669.1 hypothetical protein DV532_25575 [Pseudomonas sp. Leaf58]KQN62769.1 hypothetical protein ASF02_11530 [Pseudomonas sp. Leaf58]
MNITATHQDILGALSKSKTPLTAEEIAKSLGTLRNKVNIPLNQMLKEGLIATNSAEPGPPKFEMAEGAAKFQLSAAPAPKAAAKAAPKAASKNAAKAGSKAAPASKAGKGQKVVDIKQGSRQKQAASSANTAQAGAPVGSPSPLEPRLQILQLLNTKTRREEELMAIDGHEAILGDLIANELVIQDKIMDEMTFKLTEKGRTEFPKSFFEALPKPESVKAVAAAAAPASSEGVTATPTKRRPGRPSNKELAERRAAEAASAGTATNTQVDAGQQAAPVLELTEPVATRRRPGRPSKAELERRAAEAGQSGAQPAAMPAPAPAPQKRAQKLAEKPSQSADSMSLSGEDMLEFNRLISRMFDEKTQNLRLQNESYRKDAVELAKSMSALAANIAAVSERILKIFG